MCLQYSMVASSLQAKKNYEQKCKEHDTCEETLKRSALNQSKDEERVILQIRFSGTASDVGLIRLKP